MAAKTNESSGEPSAGYTALATMLGLQVMPNGMHPMSRRAAVSIRAGPRSVKPIPQPTGQGAIWATPWNSPSSTMA